MGDNLSATFVFAVELGGILVSSESKTDRQDTALVAIACGQTDQKTESHQEVVDVEKIFA